MDCDTSCPGSSSEPDSDTDFELDLVCLVAGTCAGRGGNGESYPGSHTDIHPVRGSIHLGNSQLHEHPEVLRSCVDAEASVCRFGYIYAEKQTASKHLVKQRAYLSGAAAGDLPLYR